MATLAGKTILIVGGTSGIAYLPKLFATALATLQSQAAHVTIASSSQAKVDAAVARLNAAGQFVGSISGTVIDGTDEASIKSVVESIEVDHLIWTSGDALKASGYPNIDISTVKNQFDVRFWGPVIAAKYAKIKSGGSITLTLGSARVKPAKGWALIAGLTGSVEAVTRGLAVELAPIRVNAVSPGYVITELWDGLPEETRNGLFKHASETLLVKHVALPHEIAEAYLFLLKCEFITGQTIEVDGGQTLV